MAIDVTIVDYGMGNIYSVVKAFEQFGVKVSLTADRDQLSAAKVLILPGDGAFGAAAANLKNREIFDVIENHIQNNRWLFGICLGFQLLFEESEEFGNNRGFGFFSGKVKRFHGDFTIPHMGWNQVVFPQKHALLENVQAPANFYFIHSYYAHIENKNDELGQCNYHIPFTAIAGRGRVVATQFHPEKSHEDGLLIIKNFIKMIDESK